MNPFQVGVGGFTVTLLYVIIIAFMWRALSANLASSDNNTLITIGSAMGATL